MSKVSIILTSFNHAKYLREAIDSTLNQNFTDFELIIWDDASTDESWDIIQSYNDSRIKSFRNKQQMRGIYGINKAISEVAQGEYIAIHHSDDVWESGKLQKQVSFLDAHSHIGAVFTNALAIDEEGDPFKDENHFYYKIFDQPNRNRHEWLRRFFEKGNALCHPSVLIRKHCYQECGLYRYGLAQVGDFDMWIRLTLKYEIHVLQEKLIRFRVRNNEANASGNRPETRSRGFYEYSLLLNNYLSLKNIDDLIRVFPEAEKYCNGDNSIASYALAMAIIEIKPFNFAVQFALNILFKTLNNQEKISQIKFNSNDYIKLTGELDPLQVGLEQRIASLSQVISERDVQIASLNQTLFALDSKINSLLIDNPKSAKSVSDLTQDIIAMQNSTSWKLTRPLRGIKIIISTPLNKIHQKLVRHFIFDPRWYLEANPDVANSDISPYEHYVLFGKAEGRKPCSRSPLNHQINKVRVLYYATRSVCRSGRTPLQILKRTWQVLRSEGLAGFKVRILRAYNSTSESPNAGDLYANYIATMEAKPDDLKIMAQRQQLFSYRPRFSIVVPVYNVEEKWLQKFITSVLAQIYPEWELCIADDCSTMPHIRGILDKYAAADKRIKVVYREVNGHISAATNSALELATGDYICLMDNDDEIASNALYEFADILQRDQSIDMGYSDEDKINHKGNRFEPFFKPDWSPEALEGCMYTAHFAFYRTSIVRAIGGFRTGYDGAQDYDFVLRFTEQAKNIVHIPKVLYHWRAIPGSTAASMDSKEYVIDAAIRSLQDRVERVHGSGTVRQSTYAGGFEVRYGIYGNPMISIVIPSAGRMGMVNRRPVDLLVNVVKTIYEKNTYRNFEVIIVDNGDLRPETIQALSAFDCRYIHFDGPFNIAKKMNMGATHACGEYLLFMNDDIQARVDDWMECMLQLAQRPGVGVVGAKLHFDNGKIQHVGVAFNEGLPDHIRREFPEKDPGYFFSSCVNRNYMAVTGAVLMTRRSTFEEVKGFDERLAINYNDIDYCLKVFQGGQRIVFAAGAELFHYESISRERVVADDEITLFKNKWDHLTNHDPYYSRYFDAHPPNFALRTA